jgi:hypothetical protein
VANAPAGASGHYFGEGDIPPSLITLVCNQGSLAIALARTFVGSLKLAVMATIAYQYSATCLETIVTGMRLPCLRSAIIDQGLFSDETLPDVSFVGPINLPGVGY